MKRTAWVSYTGLLAVASVLSFVKMIVYARYMTVETFGILSTILGTYAILVVIGSLGTLEGLLKLGSMSKDPLSQSHLASAALSAGLLSTSTITLLVIIPLILLSSATDTVSVIALFCLVISAFVFGICEIALRAGMRFIQFAGAVFAKSVLSITLGVSCLYMAMPEAVIATEAASFLMVFIWFRRLSLPRISFAIPQIDILRSLLQHGLPIAVSSLSKKMSFMSDRWMILFFFGPEMLGKYSFLMLFYLGGVSVAGLVNTALGPTVLRKMAEVSHREVIFQTVALISKYIVPAVIICCVAIFLTFGSIIDLYFLHFGGDHFVSGAIIIVVGVGLMAAQFLLEWLLIGQDMSEKLIWANVAALIMLIGLICGSALLSPSLIVLCLIFTVTRGTSLLFIVWSLIRSEGWRTP